MAILTRMMSNTTRNLLCHCCRRIQAGPHPKLNACYSNKICAIGVDDTLCIFDKEQFMDGKNLTFEAKIDCMAIVKEVVLCGLSNGCIYGVHASGIPLFSA